MERVHLSLLDIADIFACMPVRKNFPETVRVAYVTRTHAQETIALDAEFLESVLHRAILTVPSYSTPSSSNTPWLSHLNQHLLELYHIPISRIIPARLRY